MEYTHLEIAGLVFLLLLFSRRIFDLALSIFITSSTLMVSFLALSVSALILAITAIPVYFLGCKVAENVYAQTAIPQGVVAMCGVKAKAPRVVHSRSVIIHEPQSWPRYVPTSAPGKY